MLGGHGNKRACQWQRWHDDVIPALVAPYLSFLARGEQEQVSPGKACGCKCCQLKISCLYFEKIDQIDLLICPCHPAPQQLIQRGLFPCSPVAPSLAVSLSMLEFTRECFLRLPPNVTGFTGAVESFLRGRQYKLESTDTLRCQYGNSLNWYISLHAAADLHVTNTIENARLANLDDVDEAALPSV
ncbi:hypothetical protein BU15DRAFT_50678 [Melanogaster broomeanus]|nr:hypothetical protein BU15DRAFT_50678 [Melanogaster broomeanus]